MKAFLSFGSFYLSPFSFRHRNQEAAIHQIRERALIVVKYLETRNKEYQMAVLFLIDRTRKREPASII